MRVAEDQGRVIADEIQTARPIDVPDPSPLATLDVKGIGREVDSRPRGPSRHHAAGLVVECARAGRRPDVGRLGTFGLARSLQSAALLVA